MYLIFFLVIGGGYIDKILCKILDKRIAFLIMQIVFFVVGFSVCRVWSLLCWCRHKYHLSYIYIFLTLCTKREEKNQLNNWAVILCGWVWSSPGSWVWLSMACPIIYDWSDASTVMALYFAHILINDFHKFGKLKGTN